MFDESHQFVSEVLEIQVKFQHVCRIVSICIIETCLDMFDELHQFVSEVLEIQVNFQHVCRIVSICTRETFLDIISIRIEGLKNSIQVLTRL